MVKSIPTPAIDSLKQHPNWVCWTLHNGSKVPVNPITGQFAKSNDSKTWGTYEQAKHRYKAGGMQGLGFMFDENAGIVGVDLDNKPKAVFTDDGTLCDWSQEIVTKLSSYTELSPSGNGLHVLCIGKIPSAIGSSKEHGFEMYDKKRWFTITGRHLPDTPNTINNAQEALDSLHGTYKPQHTEKNKVANYRASNDVPCTDEVQKMLSCIPLPLGYDEWLKICMAVHSIYPNSTGIDMLLNWDTGNFKEGENPRRVLENKFKSFGGSGVSVGTLVYYAKLYGYETIRKVQEPETVTLTKKELEEIKDAEYWRGFHDGMTEGQRQVWRKMGVPEILIDELRLGYSESIVDKETGEFFGEGVSIPIFDNEGKLKNIEYRGIDGGICYEVDAPVLFNPNHTELTDTVVVVPDNLETIKAWLTMGHTKVLRSKMTFVGLPHCKISPDSLSAIDNAKNVHVLLGCDTKIDGRGIGALRKKARFIRLPCTIGDALNHMNEKQFKRILSSGQI